MLIVGKQKQRITLLTLGRGQTVTDLGEIFEVQMQAEYFPVQLDHMGPLSSPPNR